MRRIGKVDSNQNHIVKALRFIGASVFITSDVGAGFPDLVVGWRGVNYLIEVKTKRGKLTKDQLVFAGKWRGQMCVVRDLEDLSVLLGCPVLLDAMVQKERS